MQQCSHSSQNVYYLLCSWSFVYVGRFLSLWSYAYVCSLKSKLEEASKMIHSEDESTDSSSSEDTGSEDSKSTHSGNTDQPTGDLTDGVSRATETEKPVHSPQPQDKNTGKSSSVGASKQEGNNSQGSETNKEQDTRT
ncbi:hypothetical protein ACJMK2_030567 [Sinanodonta woodiana]|uniref:Uncharacterized protein n=1 Tax=Sinanodonta woodiana TaxID=1069815 RepID=A0ABD3WW36_SINWO